MASFLLPVQPSLETAPKLTTTHVFQVKIVQPLLGTTPGTTHIHLTHLKGVRGWVESQVFWCNSHNIRVGVQMVKLATVQLVQPVGVRSTIGGPIHQEAKAPPPLGFPPHNIECKKGEG